jgi:hypothetical protein
MSAVIVLAAWLLMAAVIYAAGWLAVATVRHATRRAHLRREAKALFAHIDELELLEQLWAKPAANRRNTGPRPRKETQ